MDKVEIEILHNGRRALMSEAVARLLVKKGRARYVTATPGTAPAQTYQTRDMRAQSGAPASAAGDDLDALELDDLRALAEQRGVKVHPRAGKAKVIEALREAQG